MAIKNAGLVFPRKRITVNLAPAAVRKEGPAYDLPIAMGVLIATNQLPSDCLDGSFVVGELSLDGSVRHIRGVLPMAALARQENYKRIFVPYIDASEAALIPDLEVIPVPSLAELYDHLSDQCELNAQPPTTPEDIPVNVQTGKTRLGGRRRWWT
jgi:magnesium chelatase family protein